MSGAASTTATAAAAVGGRAMRDLRKQKRLAMAVLGVGRDKTWLDPTKMADIAKAKTREAIRDLISMGYIKEKVLTHKQHHNRERLAKMRRIQRRLAKQTIVPLAEAVVVDTPPPPPM
jgi:hypothetical protein